MLAVGANVLCTVSCVRPALLGCLAKTHMMSQVGLENGRLVYLCY